MTKTTHADAPQTAPRAAAPNFPARIGGPARVLRSSEELLSALEAQVAGLTASAAAREAADGLPVEELAGLAATGLLAVGVPRRFGGLGVAPSVVVHIQRRLAAADPSIAQTLQTHFSNVDRLVRIGSPELQAWFLPRVMAGERFGNASSERGGKTAGENTTRILPDAEGILRLNGRKYYATGCRTAEWLVVRAVDAQSRTVNVFVHRSQSGVGLLDDWNAMGQRGTASGSALFENVAVEPAFVQPNPGENAEVQLNKILTFLIHGAIQAGVARGALEDGLAFVRDKARPHPETLAEGGVEVVARDPYVLVRVGQFSARLHAAEALVERAARMLDEADADEEASPDRVNQARIAMAEAKAFSTDVALEISSEIFGLAGSSAADNRHNLNRHWRNSRTHSLHDSTAWKYRQAGIYALHGAAPSWDAFYRLPGDAHGGL